MFFLILACSWQPGHLSVLVSSRSYKTPWVRDVVLHAAHPVQVQNLFGNGQPSSLFRDGFGLDARDVLLEGGVQSGVAVQQLPGVGGQDEA